MLLHPKCFPKRHAPNLSPKPWTLDPVLTGNEVDCKGCDDYHGGHIVVVAATSTERKGKERRASNARLLNESLPSSSKSGKRGATVNQIRRDKRRRVAFTAHGSGHMEESGDVRGFSRARARSEIRERKGRNRLEVSREGS